MGLATHTCQQLLLSYQGLVALTLAKLLQTILDHDLVQALELGLCMQPQSGDLVTMIEECRTYLGFPDKEVLQKVLPVVRIDRLPARQLSCDLPLK